MLRSARTGLHEPSNLALSREPGRAVVSYLLDLSFYDRLGSCRTKSDLSAGYGESECRMDGWASISIAAACTSFTVLCAAPVLAASLVTFVSGEGTDSGACASPVNPCRTFQFAFGQTSPGGEIKALDPADYGPITITHSISITGVDGAGVNTPSGDDITINAGPNDTVNLSRLTLDGVQTAVTGIRLNSGGSLTIANCVIRNFTGAGVQLSPQATTAFLIADTAVAGNFAVGIGLNGQGSGSAQGTLDRVSVTGNDNGLFVGAHATVLAIDSSVADNASSGIDIFNGGVVRLFHSVVTGNIQGVIVGAGTTAESAGDNVIRGNGTDVNGTLSNAGTQ
jgi:hypothetical protein